MNLNDISIRTELKPGDLGYVMYRHGRLYHEEYGFGVVFETYVGEGLHEFYKNYDREKDCVWVCEHGDQMVGFMLLMHRPNNSAQLRYFYLEPAYRGIGLGKKLMQLFMEAFQARSYASAYLWTTHELASAASLYKRHGFKLTGEKESSGFGKPLKEHRYELKF